MPRVTAIIPTFNREHLVQRALQSVLEQTYRDLEIIVCDDGSTDKTAEVVKSMVAQASLPLRLEVLPQNLGAAAARNWGIFCAKGELISFLDSDDTWKPEKLEKQIAFLDADPSYVGVGCAVARIREEGGDVSAVSPDPEITADNELYKLINSCYVTTSCFLVKKDALILSGMFDIRLEKSHDRDLWWRLPRFGRVGYINEPLVYYMEHVDSLSHELSSVTEMTYLPAIKRTVWYWRDELTEKQKRQIIAESFMLFASDASSAGRHIKAVKYAVRSIANGGKLGEVVKFIMVQIAKAMKVK